MKYLLIFLLVPILLLLFVLSQLPGNEAKVPDYVRVDAIAEAHHTRLDIFTEATVVPDSVTLALLKEDYPNIWAHLNHFYGSGDAMAGQDYYTEAWFRMMASSHGTGSFDPISRSDLSHELHIVNWSKDGLVCNAFDTNVILEYRFPDGTVQCTKARLAIALVLEGEHWRLNGLRVISETPLGPDYAESGTLFQHLENPKP